MQLLIGRLIDFYFVDPQPCVGIDGSDAQTHILCFLSFTVASIAVVMAFQIRTVNFTDRLPLAAICADLDDRAVASGSQIH